LPAETNGENFLIAWGGLYKKIGSRVNLKKVKKLLPNSQTLALEESIHLEHWGIVINSGGTEGQILGITGETH
jgi:hypothetical protein